MLPLTGLKNLRTNKLVSPLLALSLTLLPCCQRVGNEISPQITYSLTEEGIKSLPGPFPALTDEEKSRDWGKEYQIAIAFARQGDFYQAMTAFKRSLILLPPEHEHRRHQIEYDIVLTYYFAHRPEDAVAAFEESSLGQVNQDFPAYDDLLIVLHESYLQTGDFQKADSLLQMIERNDPEVGSKLYLSQAITYADMPALQELSPSSAEIEEFLYLYNRDKKSVRAAQVLNGLIPGTGYFYLGQVQSGFTALFLNALFITSAFLFFNNNNTAAGIIAVGFEAGWYFGGIYGAGLEAKLYNERVYERYAYPLMQEKQLFPGMMISHAF